MHSTNLFKMYFSLNNILTMGIQIFLLKKSPPKSKHDLEHNYKIHINIEKIINEQKNKCLNFKLKKFLVYIQIKPNGFHNILNT